MEGLPAVRLGHVLLVSSHQLTSGRRLTRNHSHFEPQHSIDFVPPNINMSHKRVQMLVFEGNMAVIQVNRSPNVRHVQEHALC